MHHGLHRCSLLGRTATFHLSPVAFVRSYVNHSVLDAECIASVGSVAGHWLSLGRLDMEPGRADDLAVAAAAAGAGAAGRCDAHARCGCSCAAACSNVADAARRRLTKTGGAGWGVRGLGFPRFLRFPTRFCQCIPSVLHTQRGDVTVPAWLGRHTHVAVAAPSVKASRVTVQRHSVRMCRARLPDSSGWTTQLSAPACTGVSSFRSHRPVDPCRM